MKEYQENTQHLSSEVDVSDSVIRDEIQKKERNQLGRKSRKPLLFAFIGIVCLVSLIFSFIVGENFTPKSTGSASEQVMTTKDNKNPEIRGSSNSEAVQEGELITDNNEEQQRLNALAEESRVYCIISSAPYFQDSESKGSLSISNPKESKYYTQVVIKTDDDKEMYVSPLLAPDEKIDSDYLTNKDFESGSYHCYAYFNYYANKDSSSYLGSMSAEINVVID